MCIFETAGLVVKCRDGIGKMLHNSAVIWRSSNMYLWFDIYTRLCVALNNMRALYRLYLIYSTYEQVSILAESNVMHLTFVVAFV